MVKKIIKKEETTSIKISRRNSRNLTKIKFNMEYKSIDEVIDMLIEKSGVKIK